MLRKKQFIFTQDPARLPKYGYDIHEGEALEMLRGLPAGKVRCWVVSPPYFNQVDYGVEGQYGLEETVERYVESQAAVARELLRCSTRDANLFVVIADSFNGSGGAGGDHKQADGSYRNATRGANLRTWPRKSQLLIPELLRIAIASTGWIPIIDVAWDKKDSRRGAEHRPSQSHEHVLIFGASEDHYWNRRAVLQEYSPQSLKQLEKEYCSNGDTDYYAATGQENPSDAKRRMCSSMSTRQGAFLRSVWHIPSGNQPKVVVGQGMEVRGRASYPLLLAEICVCLGSAPGDIVGDCYSGMGTTLLAAKIWGRRGLGIDLHPLTPEITHARIFDYVMKFGWR